MIHTYSLNGYHIALDVYSGSVHVADPASLMLIKEFEHKSRQDAKQAVLDAFPDDPSVTEQSVEESLDQLEALRAQGRLYAKGFIPENNRIKEDGKQVFKALCLHVAHACNLACSYCFAGQGHYQGEAALMSVETGKKALDFLVASSGKRRHLEVDFFGGEPLLNWDMVKEVVAYGRKLEQQHGKVFRFTLTTNGVLLTDEVIDYCNREMQNVVLSLDGRKEVHDRFRVNHKGEGSYDLVVPKFQRFVKKRGDKNYYIRGTFTHYNPDFLQDILHMADLGFTQLSMEPVVASSDDPSALTAEDMPIVFEQYELLAKEMIKRKREGRGFDFYHFNIDLEHGPCLYKRMSGCGSGTEYLAVTPKGELFPCHQFVGESPFLLGDLDRGVVNQDLTLQFQENNLASHEECAECWAKLYCAGGCAANAFHASGSIHGIYADGCEIFRKRIECAIMMQAALADEEEENN